VKRLDHFSYGTDQSVLLFSWWNWLISSAIELIDKFCFVAGGYDRSVLLWHLWNSSALWLVELIEQFSFEADGTGRSFLLWNLSIRSL